MLKIKIQHPQDVLSRAYMLDYLQEIGAEQARETLAGRVEGIFYVYTDPKSQEEKVDFNWELLLFDLPIKNLNLIMNFLEEDVWAVEAAQGKIVAEEANKKLEGGKPVDVNLYAMAKAKLAENKNKILGIDGRPIKSNRGIL